MGAVGLATIMAAPGPKSAYADGPAIAADKCPNLKELGKKSRAPGFTENLYTGVWYELAYHDVTQVLYCLAVCLAVCSVSVLYCVGVFGVCRPTTMSLRCCTVLPSVLLCVF